METFYIKPNTQKENPEKKHKWLPFLSKNISFLKKKRKCFWTCQSPTDTTEFQMGGSSVNICSEKAGSPDGKLTNKWLPFRIKQTDLLTTETADFPAAPNAFNKLL